MEEKINRPPKDYVEEEPIIKIDQHRSIDVTTGGIVKINNKVIFNSSKQSFSDIHIFYSEKRNRYIIQAKCCLTYKIDDIRLVRTNSHYKLKYPEIIGMLDLDPGDFDIEDYMISAKDATKKIFYSRKEQKRSWDCSNYIIVG